MSKFDSCLTSLNLRDSVPVDALRTTAAEYEAEGMEPAAAMLRAVEEQLELAVMEKDKIIKIVSEQWEAAGGKKKPAQKAKAQAAEPAAEPKPGAVDNTPAPIPEPEAVKPKQKAKPATAAEPDETLRASVAYHGTPHEFDKFTLDHMGAGEGAQAYGYGLYFAGERKVAEYYREGLSAAAGKKGQLYKVDIPDDDQFLHLDKPLAEQSESVKAALRKVADSLPRGRGGSGPDIELHRAINIPAAWHTGRWAYNFLAKQLGKGSWRNDKAASELLNAHGIPGAMYADALSRGQEDQTYNYVLYDAGAVSILEKEHQESPKVRANVGRTIEVDGVRRPITNSKGQLVAQDFAGQQAFWKWAGDTKVVDERGQPLVIYHGTKNDIAAFSEGKIGSNVDSGGWGTGFYFAGDADYADVYAGKKEGSNIIPAYVALQNPLVVDLKEWGSRADAIRSLGLAVPRGDFTPEWSTEFAQVAQAKGYDGVLVTMKGKPEEIVAFRPEQIKSATGNDGSFSPDTADITAATSTATSPMDSTVAELVKGGAKVGAVLERIAKDSANPDFRALAQAFLAQNLKTALLFERAKGTYTAGVNAAMATAAYKASTDTAYLHQMEGAEQNVLHELSHAATLKALAKGGLAAQQIKSLWRHVKALPNFAGEYGITNEEEFVAEAFTSPRFRQMLADTPAPGSKLSFWDKLVGIVKMLLGKPPVADSVLARVMAAGPGLMEENNAAQDSTVQDDMPLAASGGELSAAFKRWFGDSKVVNERGEPLVVYHGTTKDFDQFKIQTKGRELGFHFGTKAAAEDRLRDTAKRAKRDEFKTGARTLPVYLSIKNPLRLPDAGNFQPYQLLVSTEKLEQPDPDTGATIRIIPGPLVQAGVISKEQADSVMQATRDSNDSYEKRARRMLVEMLEAKGYDGIVYTNAYEDKGKDSYIAFRPEQVKSAIGNNGEFDPVNPDLRASITAGTLAQQISSGIDAATLRDIPRVLGNRLKDFRGIGLAALGRRQLVDIYAPDFAPDGKESLLSRYSKLMQQMDADKNEAGAEADGIADRWGKLKDGTQLADLMHDSTLAQIDPAKEHQAGDNRAAWSGLNSRYKALSPDAQKLYTDARDAYDKHWQKVRAEIRGRIERATPDSPRRAALLEKMDATFYEKVKGVYFPLARFGDYVVTVQGKDGTRLSVNFAETMNEADALRKELMKKYPGADGYVVSKVTKKKEFNAGRDTVSRGFMQELFGVLDQYESGGQLQDDINQLYLASMPDLSWAKHGIHRKGTPGFSQDARRAFAQNMFHGARYLAKLRYGDRLADFLTEMQDHLDSKVKDAEYDSVKAQQVVDEMTKRHESYMNPKGSALSSTLTSLGFIFYLGLSPASAAVNLSQTPLVTLPMLAAKYGFGKASAALLEASKQAAGNRNDISKALTGDELRAYQDAVAAGVIDVSMAHDLAGIASGDDTRAHAKLRPVMKWASWMFHHGEKFNRQASLMAAYRLARGAGQAHDAAYAAAVEDVYASHFDYSASNRPRVMQGNVAKVVLLFKQYAQNMIYTLSRNAVLAAKGDKVALKTLAGLLVSHALAAGVLGLPIVGTLLAVATALGSDDDEPWDAKVALRNQLADLIGQKPAEVLMHGVSRMGPWDVSGRVGLDKLILPDVQEGLEGARAAEAWMTAALGPVAGIGMSTMKGLNNIAEGNVLRGLEDMLPVSVRNPLKALRFATEGVQDKTGIPIVDDTSALEELGQAIGFSPSRSREANEGKGAVYRAERQLNDRRAALVAQWAHARMAGDAEGAAEIRTTIAGFNEKNPSRRITQVHLTSSLRQRNKRIAQAENGVYLPKKHQDVRELGRFAEQD